MSKNKDDTLPEFRDKETAQFLADGFLGPFDLISKGEIDETLKRCKGKISSYLLPNILSRHTVVKSMAVLGSDRQIINRVRLLLAEDILLWGSQLIKQKPHEEKRFHVDAEFTAIDGVAVWIAVKNVVPESTIFLIAGSHHIQTSPQELNKIAQLNLYDAEAVLMAAKKLNPHCRLVKLNITDGQYFLFHGRLWHGAANVTSKPRYSINFRYAKTSEQVRISKDGELPSPKWLKLKPICMLVNGKDQYKLNKTIELKDIRKIKGMVKGIFYYLPKNVMAKLLSKISGKFMMPDLVIVD